MDSEYALEYRQASSDPVSRVDNNRRQRQIPMHSAVSEYIFAPPVPKVLRKEDFDDHSKVYFALADKSSVKIYPLTDARVIFGDDKEGAIATIESFDEIYKTVRDKIIPAFTPFLP
jgi:hypothetical protein